MTLLVYRIVIAGLLVVGVYDWFTSFVGAVSLFGLGSSSPLYLWGLPIALSIGAVTLNLITRDILESAQEFKFLRVVWLVFMLFDYYTSFLGIAHIASGTLFEVSLANLGAVFKALTGEMRLVVAILSLIVVVSPMSAFMIIKKADEL